MKIAHITQDPRYSNIYEVTFIPNWLEKLFNVKSVTHRIKDTKENYLATDGGVYCFKDGELVRNGSNLMIQLDRYRRSFE